MSSVNLFLNMILASWEKPSMVARSIDSVKDCVDGIYITVTYGDEKPSETAPLIRKLKRYGANISYFKWVDDFAAARNFALDQVPMGENNYIYWQDADDVLSGGKYLHKIAEDAHAQRVAAVFFHYWYMVDLNEDGSVRNVVIDHVRERVIRHDGTFKWIGGLHETLIEQRQENVLKIGSDKCTVVHMSTSGERMDANIKRNIRILEKRAEEEQHKDPRTLVYLAKAYVDRGKMSDDAVARKIDFDMALALFHEYLEGSGKLGSSGYREPSGWAQERSTAWGYIGEVAVISKNLDAAIGAYQNAVDEAPEFPNYYIDMALVYSMKGEIKKAKHWLKMGMGMDIPQTTIITTPRDIKARALEVSYSVAMTENDLETAMKSVEELIQIYPNNKELQKRLEVLQDAQISNKAAQSIVFLGKYLESQGAKKELSHLVKAIPSDLQQEKFASEMKHRFLPKKTWKDGEIAILCGPGVGEWTPESTKTGLGGSEEAVVYLSQELKKLGWKITVYANPGTKAGDYDGVKYLPWYDLNPRDSFNVLVLWRNIGFVDFEPDAKFIMVWLHDVPSNPDFTAERINKVDKIAVLSEFHKSLLRFNNNGKFEEPSNDKIFLTSNGITPMKTYKKVKRDPYRLIYSSSPDRGLVYLLQMWPDIVKEVPEANLHVYYGFETFDRLYADNPGKQKWKNMVLDLMKQPGITYHGRVGHGELHKEMARTGIWAYPTGFEEISCITAMKAQTLGAIPVVTDYAALKETVRNGMKVDKDITTEEGQEEYKKQLIKILKDHKLQEDIRPGMMTWAKEYFLWENVAKQWDQILRISLQNPELRKVGERDAK